MPSLTGRRIVTVIGPGVRRMVGRGSVTNRGVGRRITTDAGSITTTPGPGCREAISTRSEAGGDLRSSRLSDSIFHLATISAGIRCRTTSAIRIRVITGVTIRTTVAADVIIAMDVMRVVDEMVDVMVTDATEAGGATVADVTDAVRVENGLTVETVTGEASPEFLAERSATNPDVRWRNRSRVA